MSSLSSVPWPATAKPAAPPAVPPPQPAPPAPPGRKLTSPFSWLSRTSTSGKDPRSPPIGSTDTRRNTQASVSTLNTFDEGDSLSIGSRKPGLRDQFKLLRLREEGEGPDADQASIASGQASVSQSAGTPTEEHKDNISVSSPAVAASSTFPAVNPNLAPGTVAGISTSATDAAVPVDWELWENIVNNGPSALTGANSEEINAAIKRGIPQTIRGVIWQVLADSHNPELEEMYRDLVARGTDKERHISVNGAQSNIHSEKESLASSRSSVRSDHSVSPSLSNHVTPSSSPDTEKAIKDQLAAEVARKKKAKEDTEAIRKLEKTIRRDMGSRTSYSKYFVSQGSQEALFGLCKAYALYDEAVGYAQGINFIAMPLLFNVSAYYSEASSVECLLIAVCRWMRPRHLAFS